MFMMLMTSAIGPQPPLKGERELAPDLRGRKDLSRAEQVRAGYNSVKVMGDAEAFLTSPGLPAFGEGTLHFS
jgi:hypothetical protein